MLLLIFIFVIVPLCVIIAIPLGIVKAKQDARSRLVQEEILRNMNSKS